MSFCLESFASAAALSTRAMTFVGNCKLMPFKVSFGRSLMIFISIVIYSFLLTIIPHCVILSSMEVPMAYWAHCKECKAHFETKTGTCPECRLDHTVAVETGAELGCFDCAEHANINRQIESALKRMAMWPKGDA